MFTKVYLGGTPVKAIYQGDKQIQYNIINYVLYSDTEVVGRGVPNSWGNDRVVLTVPPELLKLCPGKKMTYSCHIRLDNAVARPSDVTKEWTRVGGEVLVEYEDGKIDYIGGVWLWPDKITHKYTNANARWHAGLYIQNKPVKFIEVRISVQGLASGLAKVSRPMLNFGTNKNNWVPAPQDNAEFTPLPPPENPIYLSTNDGEVIQLNRDTLEVTNKKIINNAILSTAMNVKDNVLYLGYANGLLRSINAETLVPIAESQITDSKINDIMIHPGGGLFVSSETALIKAGLTSLSNITQTNDGDSYKESILINSRIYALRGSSKIMVYDGNLGLMQEIQDMAAKSNMTVDTTRVHTIGPTNYARFDINTYQRSFDKALSFTPIEMIQGEGLLYILHVRNLYKIGISSFSYDATYYIDTSEAICAADGGNGKIYIGTKDGYLISVDKQTWNLVDKIKVTGSTIRNIVIK